MKNETYVFTSMNPPTTMLQSIKMADVGEVDLHKLKVPELKQALKDRGLPVSGTKPELIKRLGEALGTAIDSADDGLEDSLQGIDDILNDDSVPVAAKKTPAAPSSPVKPVTSPVKQAAQPPKKADTVSTNGKTETKKQSEADTTHAGKPAEVAKLSNEERLKMRAEKFGASSAEAKKELRAQRFGLPTTGGSTSGNAATTKPSGENLDLLKKRAERFGTVVSTSLSKVDEEERKRKRAERFGVVTNTSTTKKSISVNSTDPEVEAKKRKRAERFGIAT